MASLETTHHLNPRALHCFSLLWSSTEDDKEEAAAGAPAMVKFSKQFEGQLVPEWKEAFVDYWQLKKDVKKLQAAADGAVALASPLQPAVAPAHWVMRLPFFHPHGQPAAIQACTYQLSLALPNKVPFDAATPRLENKQACTYTYFAISISYYYISSYSKVSFRRTISANKISFNKRRTHKHQYHKHVEANATATIPPNNMHAAIEFDHYLSPN
jgi:hypothetical protein